jgi:hypothetical protein
MLHAVRRKKTNRIGHFLRRCCYIKDVIEGKLEGRIQETKTRKKM